MESNFCVIDGGTTIEFKDCDDLRYYLYSVRVGDNKPKVFNINFSKIGCEHRGFTHHTNQEIVDYIAEYMSDIGYTHYMIQNEIKDGI